MASHNLISLNCTTSFSVFRKPYVIQTRHAHSYVPVYLLCQTRRQTCTWCVLQDVSLRYLSVRQLSLDIPTDAGFLCDKDAMLGDTIKERSDTLPHGSLSRTWQQPMPWRQWFLSADNRQANACVMNWSDLTGAESDSSFWIRCHKRRSKCI